MTADHRRANSAEDAPKAVGPTGISGAQYAGLGLQFAVAILLFLYLGSWLDGKLGTSWLTIVGAFVGAGGGFYSIYRKLMAEQRADQARRAAKRAAGEAPR
jgi:F0F1-type ATP synthase assembly protein I